MMRRKGIRLSQRDFEAEVARALDDIPEQFAALLDNVAVVVDDEPDAATRAAHGPILGLYEGVPLTAGSEGFEPSLPPCITIFQGPHERSCHSLAELRAEIRETVLHEIAHQFGMDDDDLDALGPLRPHHR
jgi:predicted Zn-dependent protease with MMP-like domain